MNGFTMKALSLRLSIFRLLLGGVNCVSPDENLSVLSRIANQQDNQSLTGGRQSFNAAESGRQWEASTGDFKPIRRNGGNSQSFANLDENAYVGSPVNPAELGSSSSGLTQSETIRPAALQGDVTLPPDPTSSVPLSPSQLMEHEIVHYLEQYHVTIPVVTYHTGHFYVPRVATLVRPKLPHSDIAVSSKLSPAAKSYESAGKSNFPSRSRESPSTSETSDSPRAMGISTGLYEARRPDLPVMPKGTRPEGGAGNTNKNKSQVRLLTKASQSYQGQKSNQDEISLEKTNSVSEMTDEKKTELVKITDDVVTLNPPRKVVVQKFESTPHSDNRSNIDLDTTEEASNQIQKIKSPDVKIPDHPQLDSKTNDPIKKEMEKSTDHVAQINSPKEGFTEKKGKYDDVDQDREPVLNFKGDHEKNLKKIKGHVPTINSPIEKSHDPDRRKPVSKIHDDGKRKLQKTNDNAALINTPANAFTQNAEKNTQPENQGEVGSHTASVEDFPKVQNKGLGKTFLEVLNSVPKISKIEKPKEKTLRTDFPDLGHAQKVERHHQPIMVENFPKDQSQKFYSEVLKSHPKSTKLDKTKDDFVKTYHLEEKYTQKTKNNYQPENWGKVGSHTNLRNQKLDKTSSELSKSLPKIKSQEEISKQPNGTEKLQSPKEHVQNLEVHRDQLNIQSLNKYSTLNPYSVLNYVETEENLNKKEEGKWTKKGKGKLKKGGENSHAVGSVTGNESQPENKKITNKKGVDDTKKKTNDKNIEEKTKAIEEVENRVKDEIKHKKVVDDTKEKTNSNKMEEGKKAIEDDENRVKDEVKNTENHIEMEIVEDEIEASLKNKHEIVDGNKVIKLQLDSENEKSRLEPGPSSNGQAKTPTKEILNQKKETGDMPEHLNEFPSGPLTTEPKIPVQVSSGLNERSSLNKKRRKKASNKSKETSQLKSQELESSSVDKKGLKDDMNFDLNSPNSSKVGSKGKEITTESPDDKLKLGILQSMEKNSQERDKTNQEILAIIISEAFDPKLHELHELHELHGFTYLNMFKTKMEIFLQDHYSQETLGELGLENLRRGNLRGTSDSLGSKFQELVEKHLDAENSQDFLLISDMDFNLFKKFRLIWFIDGGLFLKLPTILSLKLKKAEVLRRMQTFTKQLFQHTVVENWDILKTYLIGNNYFTPEEADSCEEAYMLKKQFPFVTDHLNCCLKRPAINLLEHKTTKIYHVLHQILGFPEFPLREALNHQIKKLKDELPSWLKSEELKNYNQHTDLELFDIIYVTQALGLSFDEDLVLLVKFEDAELRWKILYESMVSRKQKLVPWHESSTRHFLVKKFGDAYSLALERTCTRLDRFQLSVDSILNNSKAKNVRELQMILDTRKIDLIRFADIGLDLNILKIIMLSIKKDEEGKRKINWDLFEDNLPVKLNEKQKSEVDLWFKANTECAMQEEKKI